jgi:hypothetical protein
MPFAEHILRDFGLGRAVEHCGQSALMLVAARLRHVAGTKWGLRRYMDMGRLREMDQVLAERTTETAETTAAA